VRYLICPYRVRSRLLKSDGSIGLSACARAATPGWRSRLPRHEVRLMPAQHIKAYVKRNKNDAADAAAMNGIVG
jgi:transposase